MSAKYCIAIHDYEAGREDEISFEKDDLIKVLDDSISDWWVGAKEDRTSGFFPSNFVRLRDESETAIEQVKSAEATSPDHSIDHDDEPITDAKNTTSAPPHAPLPVPPAEVEEEEGNIQEQDENQESATPDEEKKVDRVIGMARVMEDYAMQESGELTLHRGGIVNVYEIIDDEWQRGELNGKVGKFPSKHVEGIDMPGRPDLGSASKNEQTSPSGEEESSAPKSGFKLAAYGIKQGGIGGLMAGGFPVLKKAGASKPSPEKKAIPPTVQKENPKTESQIPTVATTIEEKEKFLGKAIVLHPYDADADAEDEINLIRGEYVQILDRNADEGWWKGKNELGKVGIFPSNYVKEIQDDTATPPPPTRSRKSVTSVNSSSSSITSPSAAVPPPIPGNSRPSSVTSSTTATSGTRVPPTVPGNNRPTSNHSNTTMARPPQVPRPSSVQTSSAVKPNVETGRPKTVQVLSTADADSITSTKPFDFIPANTPPTEDVVGSPIDYAATATAKDEPVISEDIKNEKVYQDESLSDTPIAEEDQLKDSLPVSEERRPSADSIKRSDSLSESIKSPETETGPVVIEQQQEEEAIVEEPFSPIAEKENQLEQISKEGSESPERTNEDDVVIEEEKDDLKDTELNVDDEPIVTEADTPSDAVTDTVTETKPEEPVEAQSEENQVPVDAKEEEEKKDEFGLPTSGPKLTAPTRAKTPGRTRRPQTTENDEPSQFETLQKGLNEAPAAVSPDEKENKNTSSSSPPAKPIKPIFAKFPTPFANSAEDISKRNLKPTQTRKLWEEKNQEEQQQQQQQPSGEEPARPSGVKGLANRFNFAGNSSGGSNEVLETKLKNHTKNEIEKLKKEYEQQLKEEREKTSQLRELVDDMLKRIEQLESNASSQQ